jgi:tRNA(adenine34) deaminase
MMTINHEGYMQEALGYAKQAEEAGEVPVGAVLVCQGEVIAGAYNQPIGRCDPTAHAECLVLRQAAHKTNNYRLIGATLYVTLEPCLMCLGAMVHARIAHLCYGASDPKVGVLSSGQWSNVLGLNHRFEVTGGVLQDQCSVLLKQFFRAKR